LLDAQMPEMDGFTLAETIRRHPECGVATVMMLSSAGLRGDAARCRELGVSAYLTKPVRQSELLDAILAALGTQSATNLPPPLVTRHSLRENRPPMRILLVEDNAVNQLLALRLLQKQGHAVTVAANGKRALEALNKDIYDLMLMDIQMPEMNGWEATKAIRENEKATGKHIPIAAMTAHAMDGDKDRCLAAGMDDYLTKPIRLVELLAVVDRFRSHKPVSTDLAVASPSGAIDLAAVLDRLEGDRELFDEMVQLFRDECPRITEQIRRAVEVRNADAVERHAHNLRGSSANLGATAFSHAVGALEDCARSGTLEFAEDLFRTVEQELYALLTALEILPRGVAT
jgi:two-component system, sensor histidine kinase and response regulator